VVGLIQFLRAGRRARLIARIERLRRSRVILLVHRQETMSLLGFPLMRYIDVNDAEEVLSARLDQSIGRADPGGKGRSACTAATRSATLAGRLMTRRQGTAAAAAVRG